MAEAAGLVLGILGVAGLFSTCIECFDIVVAGKNFSEDYEQLFALVSSECSTRLRRCTADLMARSFSWNEFDFVSGVSQLALHPNQMDGE